MKFIYTIALAGVFLVSCEMHTEFTFEKNYSGSYAFTLDYSQLLAFGKMAESDSSSQDLDMKVNEQEIKNFEDQINDLQGLSNAQIQMEEGIMKYVFDFERPEDIAKADMIVTRLLAQSFREDSVGVDSMLNLEGEDMLFSRTFEYSKK